MKKDRNKIEPKSIEQSNDWNHKMASIVIKYVMIWCFVLCCVIVCGNCCVFMLLLWHTIFAKKIINETFKN